MARLTEHVLVQWVDDHGAVFKNEDTDDEVLVPEAQVETLISLLQYFVISVNAQRIEQRDGGER